MIRPALILLLVAALATPAAAASYPNCRGGGAPGLSVHIGVSVGGEFSEDELEDFDRMRLRRAGIDADTVDRTFLGCLKVTRFEQGRWVTEYYNPDTLQQGPLDLTLR